MFEKLSPFVYWAQTETIISLKVDLKDVKEYGVDVRERNIKFKGDGKGAFGYSNYSFDLHLFSEIEKEYKCHANERKIDIFLNKQTPGWWPRLTSKPQKPGWLKIDFDRWKSEHNDLEDEDLRDVKEDYPHLERELEKEELGYTREKFKSVFLILYNLFQFVGCQLVFYVMAIHYFRDYAELMENTYKMVGSIMKFLHLLQYLEVLFPIFGYTNANLTIVLYQKLLRSFVLFLMIDGEERMQTKPVVFYLTVVWILSDVIRYPYYISRAYNKNIGLLTWLKHTAWIPLQPLTSICEGVIILRNIPYFEETKKFSIFLPNALNFSIYFPAILRIYLLFLILPTSYALMMGMYKTRQRKLGFKKLCMDRKSHEN